MLILNIEQRAISLFSNLITVQNYPSFASIQHVFRGFSQ